MIYDPTHISHRGFDDCLNSKIITNTKKDKKKVYTEFIINVKKDSSIKVQFHIFSYTDVDKILISFRLAQSCWMFNQQYQ